MQDELEIATSESVGVRTAKDALESEFNDYKKSVDEERESLQSDVELMTALKIEKLVLNTSDKVQAQSDHASGNLTVTLNLLTDIA